VGSPFLIIAIVMMGAMFMMTRSAKKKQQQAQEMRNQMEPGAGVRTIGGMYALVKSVNDDTVELEVAPGVHALYAKQAIAVVMDPVEYNRIVHGDEAEDDAEPAADEPAVDGNGATEAVAVEDAPVAVSDTVESAPTQAEDVAEKADAKVGGDKDASAK
jgi:preprotein translocase subunit YajC